MNGKEAVVQAIVAAVHEFAQLFSHMFIQCPYKQLRGQRRYSLRLLCEVRSTRVAGCLCVREWFSTSVI